MINTHHFELRLSRIYIYGSKGGRAIEILLYVAFLRLELSSFYLTNKTSSEINIVNLRPLSPLRKRSEA